jgi:phosphotriesterase-related protein
MLLDEVSTMIDELRKFKADGGGTVVDMTCHGWGRDPEALKEISRKSRVHIIACAGFYVEDCMPSWVTKKTVDQLAEWIEQEIKVGCNAKQSNQITDVRAGVIKTSVSRPRFSHLELKGLKAVAKAHLKTGAPISSHNSAGVRFEYEGGNIGQELLDFLEEEGINPESVILGHSDENPDIRVLTKLAKRGAFIQFDLIGKSFVLDETRADMAVGLKDRGLLTHLLLSQDQCLKPFLQKYGGLGYSDLIKRFVPMLKERGMTEEDVETLLVKNPAKALRMRELRNI